MKKLLYACAACSDGADHCNRAGRRLYRHLDRSDEWRPGRLPTLLHLQAGRRQADRHGAGPAGRSIAISEGKIDGDKISFKVVIQGGTTITHEGTINAAGDEIKLTTKSDRGNSRRRDDSEAGQGARSRQLDSPQLPLQSTWARISASIRVHTDGSFSISMCGCINVRANHGNPAQEIGCSR